LPRVDGGRDGQARPARYGPGARTVPGVIPEPEAPAGGMRADSAEGGAYCRARVLASGGIAYAARPARRAGREAERGGSGPGAAARSSAAALIQYG